MPPVGSDWHLDTTANEVRLYLDDLAEVSGVALNREAGQTQRSRITSVDVEFDGLVQIDAGAFELRMRDDGGVVDTAFTLATNLSGKSVATLTFSGPRTRGLAAALVDGNYQLTIATSKIRRLGTELSLDGNGDGLQGGDYVFGTAATDNFFSLFGDSDGDRDVDGQDYGRFGLTLLKSQGDAAFNPTFDSDGDGDVDGQDYGRFGRRFMKSLPF